MSKRKKKSKNKSVWGRARGACWKKRFKNHTPKWLTREEKDAMVSLYRHSRSIEGMTIDHIIPLNGERVSGLHTLNNLQLMDLNSNLAKGNEYE